VDKGRSPLQAIASSESSGVYAWFFRSFVDVPLLDCLTCGDFTLLYIGISPSAPPTNGKGPSGQTLYHRVRYHMQGNAEGSTLRLSLGCILAGQLGIELRRVGSGKRLTFSHGEERLSEWLENNARVTWHVCEEPWLLEKRLISQLNLPFNLDQNNRSAFHPVLSGLRREAKRRAGDLPILAR
jgi:hypothetical protein